MKKFKINKKIIVTVLAITLVFGFSPPIPVHAATSPSLGTADSFSILAGTPNITNVPTSNISGDVGLSPATGAGIGLTDSQVTGTIYAVDAAGPAGSVENAALLTTAKNDLNTAFGDLDQACGNGTVDGSEGSVKGINYGGVTKSLNGLTLVPGVYCASVFNLSGTLTLDDTADSGGVWIFKAAAGAAALTTSGSAIVEFTNPDTSSSCDVWWRVASSATIGVGTNFIGNILAATSISMGTAATLDGRALAYTGAVTLDSNTISGCAVPATTLKLVKAVTNDNGGTTLNTAWTLAATGAGGFSDNGGTGIFHTVTAGVGYVLSESASESTVAEYTAGSWSCDSESLSGSTITLSSGQNVTCTITNNDKTPELTLNKVVVNDNGGSADESDWTLTAAGPTGFSGVGPTVNNGASFDAGTYNLSETGPANYTASNWVCDEGTQVDGDTVSLALGESATCTITNNDISISHSDGYIIPPATPVFSPFINIISTPVFSPFINIISTPVVASIIPKLPKTGYPPEERSVTLPIILLASSSAFLTFLYFAQKKQTT